MNSCLPTKVTKLILALVELYFREWLQWRLLLLTYHYYNWRLPCTQKILFISDHLYAIIKKKKTQNKQTIYLSKKNPNISSLAFLFFHHYGEKQRFVELLKAVGVGKMSSTALSWLNLPKYAFLCWKDKVLVRLRKNTCIEEPFCAFFTSKQWERAMEGRAADTSHGFHRLQQLTSRQPPFPTELHSSFDRLEEKKR